MNKQYLFILILTLITQVNLVAAAAKFNNEKNIEKEIHYFNPKEGGCCIYDLPIDKLNIKFTRGMMTIKEVKKIIKDELIKKYKIIGENLKYSFNGFNVIEDETLINLDSIEKIDVDDI